MSELSTYKGVKLPTLDWANQVSDNYELKELRKNILTLNSAIKSVLDTNDSIDEGFEDNTVDTLVYDSELLTHDITTGVAPYHGWGNIVTIANPINCVGIASTRCTADTEYIKLTVRQTDENGAILTEVVKRVTLGFVETGYLKFIFRNVDGNVFSLTAGTYFIYYQAFKDAACTQKAYIGYNSCQNLSPYVSSKYIVGSVWYAGGSAVYMQLFLSTLDGYSISSRYAYDIYVKAKELYEKNNSPIFGVPNTVYALQGSPFRLEFRNIISNYEKYNVDIKSSTTGVQWAGHWDITPEASDVGNKTIEIRVYTKENILIDRKDFTLKTIATTGFTGTANVLIIGDSITADDEISNALNALSGAGAETITLQGTQGSSPDLHEAYNGYIAKSFVEAGSPFWIGGQLDFAQYVIDNLTATPDCVVINLGTNNLVVASLLDKDFDVTTMLANTTTLINNIKAAGVAKIGLCLTIPPASTQDGFSVYKDDQARLLYMKNYKILMPQYIATYQNMSGVYLFTPNLMLDTVNNFPTTSVDVNNRNSATIDVISDPVHPNDYGKQQIADCIYYGLKNIL